MSQILFFSFGKKSLNKIMKIYKILSILTNFQLSDRGFRGFPTNRELDNFWQATMWTYYKANLTTSQKENVTMLGYESQEKIYPMIERFPKQAFGRFHKYPGKLKNWTKRIWEIQYREYSTNVFYISLDKLYIPKNV